MSLTENLKRILEQISANLCDRLIDEIVLVAVTKGRTLEEIREAYLLGIRDFAENRVDEALFKMEHLPSDIRWHFIGKLQKNKVRKIIDKFALIHSVDTVELAEKISLLSLEKGIKTSVLLQANISGETTKSGLTAKEWKENYQKLLKLEGIQIKGLMTLAPLTEDEMRIRNCFAMLWLLKQELQGIGGHLVTLSMGMSNDFAIAVQEGTTLLRIGTALFNKCI